MASFHGFSQRLVPPPFVRTSCLRYRVTGSETVEPDAVHKLAIEPGKDLCTLITCAPYGANSHRLLMHYNT